MAGKGSGKISIVGLICLKPRNRPRLLYRKLVSRGRKHDSKGFTEDGYIALIDDAHQRLGGNIVLLWDRLNTHTSAKMADLVQARSWLTVYFLPTYAPELNAVEGVWSLLKKHIADLAKHSIDQLAEVIGHQLKKIQYRPDLIMSLAIKTGLDLRPP